MCETTVAKKRISQDLEGSHSEKIQKYLEIQLKSAFSAVIIIYIYLQNPENSYSCSWAFNWAAGPTCRQILQYWLTNVIFISFRLVYYLPCLASCKYTIRSHAICYMTNFLLLTRIYRSLETGSMLSLQFMIALWTSLIYSVKLWL